MTTETYGDIDGIPITKKPSGLYAVKINGDIGSIELEAPTVDLLTQLYDESLDKLTQIQKQIRGVLVIRDEEVEP